MDMVLFFMGVVLIGYGVGAALGLWSYPGSARRISTGGLVRCCIKTIVEFEASDPKPISGHILHCHCGANIVLKGNTWEWAGAVPPSMGMTDAAEYVKRNARQR